MNYQVGLEVLQKGKLSRIALRELAASGQIPGMTKASW